MPHNMNPSSNILLSMVFCMILGMGALCSQSEQGGYHKHSVYASYGTVLLSTQASVSAERTLFQKNNFRTRVRASFGDYLTNNGDFETDARVLENYLSLSVVQMIEIWEISVGVAGTRFRRAAGFDPVPGVDYSIVMTGAELSFNTGIRYVYDHFMIRAGVGNHELLYLGLGVHF